MGVVLGMTGSLLGGFYNMFEMSEDQSAARMRAQDVFNILSTPIQNAGIGIPSRDLRLPFRFYDNVYANNALEFGMNTWYGPLGIASGDTEPFDHLTGNRLRVIYGVPTGIKHIGDSRNMGVDPKTFDERKNISERSEIEVIGDFTNQIGNKIIRGFDPGTINRIDPYDMIHSNRGNASAKTSNGNTAMLIVFPGVDMMPSIIISEPTSSGGTRNFTAWSLPLYYQPSPDYLGANTIRPYHDLFMLRAAWVYVDDSNTFCFLNVYDNATFADDPPADDPMYDEARGGTPSGPPPNAGDEKYSGFMVEGIAGLWFETDTERRYVTVEVLTEGDALDENRGSAARAALESKWNPRGVELKQGVYYEEFSRTYRTRNLQQ
jgi:hypothetical protein